MMIKRQILGYPMFRQTQMLDIANRNVREKVVSIIGWVDFLPVSRPCSSSLATSLGRRWLFSLERMECGLQPLLVFGFRDRPQRYAVWKELWISGIPPFFHPNFIWSTQVMTVFCWISETSLSPKPRSQVQTTGCHGASHCGSWVEVFSRRWRWIEQSRAVAAKPLLADDFLGGLFCCPIDWG